MITDRQDGRIGGESGTQAAQGIQYDDPARVANLLPQSSVLFAIDYDGTLRGFVNNPDDAVASPDVVQTLRHLSVVHNGAVAIVSGRSVGKLREMLREPLRVRLYGSHGNERGWGDQDTLEEAIPTTVVQVATKATDKLEELVGQERIQQGMLVERKPGGMCIHWRQCPDSSDAAVDFIRGIFEELDSQYPGQFELQPGDKVLEIRPSAKTKADAVLHAHEVVGSPDHVICIGDDKTDMHMMEMAAGRFGNKAYAIIVGDRIHPSKDMTLGHTFRLSGPEQVHELLRRCAITREVRATALARTPT